MCTPEGKAECGVRREEALAKQRHIEHQLFELAQVKFWPAAEMSWTARNAF